MIKILFISDSLLQNGTQMFMMNVLRHINRSCFHIDFLIYNDERTPYRVEAESYGCKIHVLPPRKKNPLKCAFLSYLFFNKHAHEYQAVHWNGGNLSSFICLLMSWLYRIPIRIVHAHSSSTIGRHNLLLHKIHRRFLPILCNRYFACSSEASKFFFPFPSIQSVIIRNGIDTDKFDYNEVVRQEVRSEFDIPNNAIVMGHVGRFDDNKNQSFILDVFAEFNQKAPGAYLLLVGLGETLDSIKNKACALGVEHSVKFLGLRNDVHRIMQAMDCFIMPSKYEGLPFVLVEAQCSGLYCVVSDTINYDAGLTKNIKFLPLNSGKEVWSNTIEKTLNNYSRTSQSYVLKVKGFSIVDSVSYLENVYKNA